MIKRLYQCCDTGDDEQMLSIIQDLATQQDDRSAAGAVLLEALGLRPDWGPELDPKSWREEVKSCLWQLYDFENLYACQLAVDDPVNAQMRVLLDELFDQPVVIIDPVLESAIAFDKYLPDTCVLLEEILAACRDYASAPEDVDVILGHIEALEKAAVLLQTALGEKFDYCRIVLVANRLRDLLNNPETALWQA